LAKSGADRRILETNQEAGTKRAMIVALLAAAGGAECAGKWKEIVERSVAVWLDAMASPEGAIPQQAVADCRCVAVFGGVSGIFFLKTAYGTMTCRTSESAWGAAQIVSLSGLRMSATVPSTGPKLILLVMSRKAGDALAAGRGVKYGRDVQEGDILAWVRSHGATESVRIRRGSLGVEKRMSAELPDEGAAVFVSAVEKHARLSPSLR
jgi:hypothetical protein